MSEVVKKGKWWVQLDGKGAEVKRSTKRIHVVVKKKATSKKKVTKQEEGA